MEVIYEGGKKQIICQNESVKGLELNLYAIAAAVNTDIMTGDVNWEHLNIHVELHQFGERRVPYSGSIKPLIIKTMFFNDQAANVIANVGVQLVAEGEAVKEVICFPVNAEIGCYNLKGDDKLIIDISMSSDFFAADIDGSASYVMVDKWLTEETQFEITTWELIPLAANDSLIKRSLGNNIKSITLIDWSKTDLLYANRVYDEVIIFAKDFHEKFDYYKLIARRAAILQDDHEARKQNFLLAYDDLDEVELNVKVVTANVSASDQYILVEKSEVTADTMLNAVEVDKAKVRKLESKIY